MLGREVQEAITNPCLEIKRKVRAGDGGRCHSKVLEAKGVVDELT